MARQLPRHKIWEEVYTITLSSIGDKGTSKTLSVGSEKIILFAQRTPDEPWIYYGICQRYMKNGSGQWIEINGSCLGGDSLRELLNTFLQPYKI